MTPYLIAAFAVVIVAGWDGGSLVGSVLGIYAALTLALVIAGIGCFRWEKRDYERRSRQQR